VGEDAALQIARHADVECVAAAGYDVRVIELFVHEAEFGGEREKKQPQVLRLPLVAQDDGIF